MQFHTDELILAAHVRDRASELRKAAASAEWRERQATGADASTRDEYSAAFAKSHPLEEFVPAALKELERVAGVIRAHLGR